MSRQYRISIIGSGNVAWHLAASLENAGHVIQEVFSKKAAHAKQLSSKLYQAVPITELDLTRSKSKIFFICVKDEAIHQVASELLLPENSVLVHTSGTVTLKALQAHANRAVFYPLQTFSKQTPLEFTNVPVCLETNNENTWDILEEIGQSIGCKIHQINSDERRMIHLAAVFACNFTNHLLGIARYILQSQDLPPALLHPLIAETINKALANDPFTVQTGPAIRDDQGIIEKHLAMLEEIPEYKQVYKALTESIRSQGK